MGQFANLMDKEKALVLAVVEKLVWGGGQEKAAALVSQNKMDWGRAKELLIYHELTPFAYLTLKDLNSSVPDNLIEFLRNNYYCALMRCQRLGQEFLRILSAFEQANIILLPIKGVAFLQDLYTHRPLRPMTDIDLLVKEEELTKAEELLANLGYRKELWGLEERYWREHQCHLAFYRKKEKKTPFIELHWGLDFKRQGRAILPELWQRLRDINVEGRLIKLLSPEDTLFSLALHNRRLGRTLCLKSVYDAVLLLNKYNNQFDWQYVLEQSKKYNLRSTLFFILYQAQNLLELNLPGYVWRALSPAPWKKRIAQRFIEKNTFFSGQNTENLNLYLQSHFLLYDSLWRPIEYILNIPQEQFAKFYGLDAYGKRTNLLYRNRLIYIPYKAILHRMTNAQRTF